MRVSFLATVIALLLLSPPVLAQQKPALAVPRPAAPVARPAASAPVAAKTDGFRSAKFGMAAPDVRKAIQSDFGLGESDIKPEINPVQKTTALTVDVKDLLPGTGEARVSYLFGYKSNTLFSVLIVWAKAFSPENTRDVLIDAAAVLRAHFETESFAKGALVDSALADGSALVFRGIDAQGRMVALTATGLYTQAPNGGEDKNTAQPDPILRLTYIEDPQHPDVYTIKPGDF